MKINLILLIAIVSLPFQINADEFHYNNLLIGGKAIGLGGAYTAIAADLSTMHYNPAGLINVKQESTASINALSWEKTTFEEVFTNKDDFERGSFTVVPGFFALKFTVDTWAIGASFAVTDFNKERNSADVYYSAQIAEGMPESNFNQYLYIDMDNSTFELGLTVSTKYNDNLSFGSSLFVNYSDYKSMQGSGVEVETNLPLYDIFSGFSANIRMNDTRLSIKPVFGLLYKENNYSIGAKVSKNIPLTRSVDMSASIYAAGPITASPGVVPANRLAAHSDTKQNYPLQYTLGFAYDIENITLSFDINYFNKVTMQPEILDEVIYTVTRNMKEVVNFSLGTEIRLSSNNAIRLALFTDNSNGEIDVLLPYQRVEVIDLIGASASYNTFIGENEINVGFYYKYGDGKVRFAEVRAIEEIVGLELFPNHNNFDITKASKKQLVFYVSLAF
jgi:long-subunit fatty acid transport protein